MKHKNLIILVVSALAVYFFGVLTGRASAPKEEIIIKHTISNDGLTEWQLMQLAIIKTESEFDSLAVGKKEDWGIMQITPIYVKEVNRIVGEEKYIHEDAFSPKKSIEMFDIMQARHNPEKDIEKAIASHNPTATSAYSVKVRRNMELIRHYEEYRELTK